MKTCNKMPQTWCNGPNWIQTRLEPDSNCLQEIPEEEPVASSSAAAAEPEPVELEHVDLFAESNSDKKGAFQDTNA